MREALTISNDSLILPCPICLENALKTNICFWANLLIFLRAIGATVGPSHHCVIWRIPRIPSVRVVSLRVFTPFLALVVAPARRAPAGIAAAVAAVGADRIFMVRPLQLPPRAAFLVKLVPGCTRGVLALLLQSSELGGYLLSLRLEIREDRLHLRMAKLQRFRV